MKVIIEFDLSKDEDRKHYNACIKIKEITLNLETLGKKIDESHDYYIHQIHNIQYKTSKFHELKEFYEEMIWKKLT